MLKRLAAIFLCLVGLIFCWLVNSKSAFADVSNEVTVYEGSFSSLATFKEATVVEYALTTCRTGESCTVATIDKEAVLSAFEAKVLFVETTDSGVSYYAYSDKLKYCKIVNGKRVNLHIHVSEDCVKVGTPLIYGGF